MFERFNGNVVPFADESTSTNRTVFGSETQSDDIDDNLNADFKKGWEIVGLNDNPTREDFNAMGYTLGYLTSYLYQNGVAEYNLLQEYKTNSISIGTDGNIYQSLVDNNLGNALTDTTKWVCIASKNSIVNSIDELKTISNIESINVLGYYEKGDGGGGTFYWDATSTETDNGGTIIQATGVVTGRWKMVFSGAINVKWFGAKGDGVTSSQAEIVAAVAAAYAIGAELEWPTGTYVLTENIPDFWKAHHRGEGVIKRGTNTFTVSPRSNSTALNELFVSLTGSNSNDGLTSDYPLRTAQDAFDAIMSIGTSIGGRWVVNFESGTYNEYATLKGVTTREAIIVRGSDVSGGVPSVVFDGTGLSGETLNGLYFTERVNVTVRDIKFINWKGELGTDTAKAITGLSFNQYVTGWADNVHADNCDTGIYFAHSRGYIGRGVIQNCNEGTVAFAGTQIALGYGSATHYKNNQVGATIRDGSNGIIANGVFEDNVDLGVKLMHQSIVRVSNSAFSGSGRADVVAYTGSSVFFGDGNTHTLGKKFKGEFAIDLDNANKFYYDGDSNRFSFGTFGTPSYPFHFKTSITNSYTPAASTLLGVEGENPHLGLAAKSASDIAGIHIAIPGVSQQAGFQYIGSDATWRLRLNNTDAFRWSANYYTPRTDNTVSLGASSYRWAQVYSASGTINTSDAREKTFSDIPEVETQVAKELKSLVRRFKFNDAIEAKGEDKARIHYGTSAQEVIAVFEKYGLNAMEYAMVCYDEWEEQQEVQDEDGNIIEPYRPSGNRYGIRYEELLCFIISAM